MVIKMGDALAIEVPISDDGGEYKYMISPYMDRTDVVIKPIDETIEPKKSKKKRKVGAEPDPLMQLIVAIKEVKCVLFVD